MKHLQRLLLNDKFILGLIFVNAVVIFLQGFQLPKPITSSLIQTDNLITIIFLLELSAKVRVYGVKGYLSSNWNIFDALLVLLAMPSLVFWITDISVVHLDYLLVLRITRIFKFFRFIRFFPRIDELIRGVQSALRASVIVLLGFFVFIFIISIISCFFYRNISPEYFGNPFISIYSVFKIFTIEGWYEIPDSIAAASSTTTAVLTKLFFGLILLLGGVFGLSLVNSIFVDAMVSDNNDDLEEKVGKLEAKIDLLLERQDDQLKDN
jgi:voltage-gated sodium channel